MMFGLLTKMKRKIMVGEAFVLFFLFRLNSMVEARTFLCSEIDTQNDPDENLFDAYMFVY